MVKSCDISISDVTLGTDCQAMIDGVDVELFGVGCATDQVITTQSG